MDTDRSCQNLVVDLAYRGLTEFYSPVLSDLIRLGEQFADIAGRLIEGRIILGLDLEEVWSEAHVRFYTSEWEPPPSDSIIWGYASGFPDQKSELIWTEPEVWGLRLQCAYQLYLFLGHETGPVPGYFWAWDRASPYTCRGGPLPLRSRLQTERMIRDEIVAGGGIWRGW